MAAPPLFGPVGLEQEVIPAILPLPKLYQRGARLTIQGESPPVLYWIDSGIVKKMSSRGNGKQVILGLRTRGWVVGALGALSPSGSQTTSIALTDCLLRPIPFAQFEELYRDSGEFANHLQKLLRMELTLRVRASMGSIAQWSARERLAQFLKEIGNPDPRGGAIHPHLKQGEIAQLLSITPEHLSRLIHEKQESFIRSGRERASGADSAEDSRRVKRTRSSATLR